MGTMYSAAFSAVAVTAAQDVFELVAPAASPIFVREIRLGQYTDFGDAAAEILSVTVIRGFTTSGSGGSSVTPGAFLSGAAASATTVEANNTTVAQTGTGVTLIADTFNVQAGWFYREEPIAVAPGERIVVRITAPADSLTMNGTIVFEEGR